MNCVRKALRASSLLVLLLATCSFGTEGGGSSYALGANTKYGGLMGPPGHSFTLVNYIYPAKSHQNTAAFFVDPALGTIVDLDIDIEVTSLTALTSPTYTWTSTDTLLGGRYSASVWFSYGGTWVESDIIANGDITFADGSGLSVNERSSAKSEGVGFGPVAGLLTWGRATGNYHYRLQQSVATPTGEYDVDNAVNTGANRWAFDTSGFLTWLNPETGWESTGSFGTTMYTKNDDRHYQNGRELHAELGVSKALSSAWGAGIAGYHLWQYSDDKGSGAESGPMRGRISGVGLTSSYNNAPASLSAKVYHEFDAENKPEGTVIYLTASTSF